MRRLVIYITGLLLALTALKAVDFQDYYTARAADNLALSLFKQLYAKSENLVFSPISLYGALSMAYAGSSGDSKQELGELLKYNADEPTRRSSFLRYTQLFNSQNQPTEIIFKQGAFFQKGFDIREEFKETLHRDFDANIESHDFKKDPTGSANKINNWAADATKQKITKVVTANSFQNNVSMLMAQALYFKGDWLYTFQESSTIKDTFFNADGTEVQFSFMRQTKELPVFEAADYHLLSLPYRGNKQSLLFILPKKGKQDQVFKHLVEGRILKASSKQMYRRVKIKIPKFNLLQDHSLRRPLMSAGLYKSFIAGKADFSRIAGQPGQLFISHLNQKALIELNETGTVAAAVTTMSFAERSAVELEKPEEISLDRPFFFILQDHSLVVGQGRGATLFAGYFGMAKAVDENPA